MGQKILQDLLFIIIVILISGLLGFLIAWFWKNAKHKKELDKCADDFRQELEQKEHELDEKNQELASCKSELEKYKTKVAGLEKQNAQTPNQSTEQKPSFDPEQAKKIMGKNIKENDLKIIEGIGPKIEELFKKSGIDTWKKLAETPASTLKKILDEQGGKNFKMHDPGTWPQQAKLAYQGKWKELKELQDKLVGGR